MSMQPNIYKYADTESRNSGNVETQGGRGGRDTF